MRRLVTIVILCAGCVIAASAQASFTQRLQQSKQGEGKVTVTQDKAIDELVNGPKVVPVRQQPAKQVTTTPQVTPQSQTDNKKVATTPQAKPDSVPVQPRIVTETPQQPDTTVTDEGRKKIMKGGYKINGYRVQVYAGGNSRDARVRAERVGKEINALFPGEPIYVHFYSPRWICRMGNYRTYEEASEILRAVKKLGYTSAIIVKGKITVQYLPPSDANVP